MAPALGEGRHPRDLAAPRVQPDRSAETALKTPRAAPRPPRPSRKGRTRKAKGTGGPRARAPTPKGGRGPEGVRDTHGRADRPTAMATLTRAWARYLVKSRWQVPTNLPAFPDARVSCPQSVHLPLPSALPSGS